jgi:hypothetical protein
MTSSPNLETTPIKVFNVKSLSIFISLGVHALFLFLALPVLSNLWEKQKAEQDESVGLVELSAAEQSRLPDLSQKTLADSSYANNLTGIDSSQLNSSSLPSPSYPSSNQWSSLPPPPTGMTTIPYSNSTSIQNPPTWTTPTYSSPAVTPNNYYPQTSTPNLPPPPTTPTPRENYNQIISSKLPSADPRRQLPFSDPNPPLPINELINRKVDPDNRTNQPINVRQQTITGQTVTTVDPKQSLREQRFKRLLMENIQGAESLVADRENTSQSEVRTNEETWRKKVKVAQPTQLVLSGSYPKAACLGKLEGTTIYGVLINAQGKVSTDPYRPYLIKSAGYPVLNQQAIKDLQAQNFNNQTGKLEPHQIVVNYKYDPKVCPSVAIAQSRSNQAGQTPQTQTPTRTTTPTTNTTSNTAPSTSRKVPQTSETVSPANLNNANQVKPEHENPLPTNLRQKPQIDTTVAPRQNRPTQTQPTPQTPNVVNNRPASSLKKPSVTTAPQTTPTTPTTEAQSQPTRQRNRLAPVSSQKKPEATSERQSSVRQRNQPTRTSNVSQPKPTVEALNPAPKFKKIPVNTPLGPTAPRKTVNTRPTSETGK